MSYRLLYLDSFDGRLCWFVAGRPQTAYPSLRLLLMLLQWQGVEAVELPGGALLQVDRLDAEGWNRRRGEWFARRALARVLAGGCERIRRSVCVPAGC